MKIINNSKWIYFIIPTLFIVFCGRKKQNNSGNYIIETVYEDEILRKIADCKSSHNSQELVSYLTNENAKYREAATLACASIADTIIFEHLLSMLNDYNEEVRIAASYSLGMIGMLRTNTEQILIDFFESEQSLKVRMNILEAIGKCGTEHGLNYISELNIPNDKIILLTGQILGLSRFAIRNLISDKSTTKVISLLDLSVPQKVRMLASVYLTRTQIDSTNFETLNKFKRNTNFNNHNIKHIDTVSIKWDLIRSVSANQEIRITTTKGDFIIQLKVNEMPITVSNFLQLLSKNHYNNTKILKSNFGRCVFTGSNTVNIDTSLNYFPLEKIPAYFEKGSVGITTSEYGFIPAQCFITTTLTPECDDKFANFGTVTSGMNIVNSLELGDSVLSFRLME